MSLEKEIFKDVTMGETSARYMDIFSTWAEAFKRIERLTDNKEYTGIYTADTIYNPSPELTFTAHVYADETIPPLEMTVKASVEKEGFRMSLVTEDESIIGKVTEKMTEIDEECLIGATGLSILLKKGSAAEILRTTIMDAFTTAPAFLAHAAKAAALEMEGKLLPKILKTPQDMENYYCATLCNFQNHIDSSKKYSLLTQDKKGVWLSGNFDANKNNPLEIQIEASATDDGLTVTLQTNDNDTVIEVAANMLKLGTGLNAVSKRGGMTIGTTITDGPAATKLLDVITKALQNSPLFLNHIKAAAMKQGPTPKM